MYKYLLALVCITSTCAAEEASSRLDTSYDYSSGWDSSDDSDENNDLLLLSPICSDKDCYTIDILLGSGAFGKVYKVQGSKGQNYALKSYKYSHDINNSWWGLLEDAEREYLRGQMLGHPNIIKSFDFFTHFNTSNVEVANIVLELVKGREMDEQRDHSLPYNKVKVAAKHFIDAVRHAVSINLMHLDLHGGNVMLTEKNDVKIIDLASFFSVDEVLSFNSNNSCDSDSLLSKEEYRNNLKNWEFSKEDPQDFHSERATIVLGQGSSENGNPEVSPTPLKTKSSGSFGIKPMRNREKKIHQFIMRNPELKAMLEEDAVQIKGLQAINPITDQILFDYFSDVAYFYITIIEKSDLSPKKIKEFEGKVEKIRQRYETRIKKHKKVSMEDYLDELSALVK